MLNPTWADAVLPPPGYVLVRRDVPAVHKSGIFIPDSYRNAIRMCLATVMYSTSLDGRGDEIVAGDRVMLASSAGDPILFGYTKDDERELWIVPPQSILVRFFGEVNEATDRGSHFLRNQKPLEALDNKIDKRWAEGDRQGPQ